VIFCDNLQPRVRIKIEDKNGNITEEKIVRQIIMEQADGDIYDVEILLDKKKNRYFSYTMFKKGISWVKNIEIIKDKQ
jgi:hypothetical protein